MKPKHSLLIGLLSVASIVVVSACSPRNTFRAHFGSPEEKAAHRIEYAVDKLTRTLDLDDAQQARLRTMAETLHARMAEIRKDHEKGKAEVIAMVEREKVEAREIDDLLAKKMQRIEPVRRLFAENMAAFHAMLTPKQREKLAAAIQDHEPGRCRFGGKW